MSLSTAISHLNEHINGLHKLQNKLIKNRKHIISQYRSSTSKEVRKILHKLITYYVMLFFCSYIPEMVTPIRTDKVTEILMSYGAICLRQLLLYIGFKIV